MIYNKLLFGFVLFLLNSTSLQAQETTLSSGGKALGSGGSSNYSIGQIGYTVQSGSGGSVELGVQQPYSILTSFGFELETIQLELTAYPNPTQHALTLKVEDYNQEELSYYLFDLQGKLLETKRINGSETRIIMENLSSSTYFLKIEEKNQFIKSFSIIKN